MIEQEGLPTGFPASHNAHETMETIKVYVDTRFREADRRYEERYQVGQRAMEKAEASLNERLGAMNEFRAALSDAASRTPTRVELEVSLNTLRTERTAMIVPLRDKVEAMGKPNWPLYAGLIGIVFSLISGGMVIVQLKIDGQVAPTLASVQTGVSERGELRSQLQKVDALALASTAADASSRADRAELATRLGTVETRQEQATADLLAAQAENVGEQRELRAQVKGLSNTFNIIDDHQQRISGLLWAHVYKGQTLPITPFRPDIAR